MIGARPFAAMLAAVLAAVFTLCAASAQAQQMYRWTDEKGGVHITDTPPPPSAKDVQKSKTAATVAAGSSQRALRAGAGDEGFPGHALHRARTASEPCAKARAALNKRGVPFKEIQVWDEESNQELKQRLRQRRGAGAGRRRAACRRAIEQGAFDALLDSARYPRAGVLPARNQAGAQAARGLCRPAPGAAAEPLKAEDEPKPAGPYAPRFSK